MTLELLGRLLKRRSVVESTAETWESAPATSSADASHHGSIRSGTARVPAPWTCDITEEDPFSDAWEEILKSRGARPKHAPRLPAIEGGTLQGNSGLVLQEQPKCEARATMQEQTAEDETQRQAQQSYVQPTWLDNLENTMNVAVVGNSGVGKSLLINKLRRVRPGTAQWAPVGVNETTMRPTVYTFPGNSRIRMWDLPGAGTPDFPQETYIQRMGLRYFDSVLIVTAGRFTTMEMHLQEELRQHRVPFFMVDADASNNMLDNGIPEETTLQQIRDELRRHGADCPYLVSAREPDQYDMRSLLSDAFPGLKQHLDAIDFMFCPAEGTWDHTWVVPSKISPVLSKIQGTWIDKANGLSCIVDGSEAHVTTGDGPAVESLSESDGRAWFRGNWYVDLQSATQGREGWQLTWTPLSSESQPLVWHWNS